MPPAAAWSAWAAALLIPPLSRRFQMERLVRFNQKFSPRWQRRYLVYQSRAALPRTCCACCRPRATSRPAAAAAAPSPAGAAARGDALAARQGREVTTGVRRLPRRRPVVLALALMLAVVGLVGAYRYWESYYQHRGFATVAYLPHAHQGRRLVVNFYSPALHRQRRLPGLPAAGL